MRVFGGLYVIGEQEGAKTTVWVSSVPQQSHLKVPAIQALPFTRMARICLTILISIDMKLVRQGEKRAKWKAGYSR
jgi:hypothetical protein